MKEIIAIIRPNKMNATKKALEEKGFSSMTAMRVIGRGKQKGLLDDISPVISEDIKRSISRSLSVFDYDKIKKEGARFIPKRLISLIVPDDKCKEIVDTIIKTNQTGNIGDGKIFVLPVEDAIRIRTGEKGDDAII